MSKLRTRAQKGKLEAQVERPVMEHARKIGLLCRKYKTPNHRSSPDDIFLPAFGRAFFIEFKREKGGVVTHKQKKEHHRLRSRGYCVYVCNNIEQGKAIVEFHNALI